MTDKKEKERQDFKDDFIKDIVEKGNRTILNENFENQIMQQVYSTAAHKKEVNSKLKRSMRFFYFGISLIGIYALITIIGKSMFNNLTILVLFFTIVFGIVMIGNFKRFLHSFSI